MFRADKNAGDILHLPLFIMAPVSLVEEHMSVSITNSHRQTPAVGTRVRGGGGFTLFLCTHGNDTEVEEFGKIQFSGSRSMFVNQSFFPGRKHFFPSLTQHCITADMQMHTWN